MRLPEYATALEPIPGGLPARAHWDIKRSLELAPLVRARDPDLAQPGWCWNTSISVLTFLDPKVEARYVEGWLHNRHPAAPHPIYPHAWVSMPDGSILDLCSGADRLTQGQMGSLFVFYHPVHSWNRNALASHILTVNSIPPFTHEFQDWDPDEDGYPVEPQPDLFEDDEDPFAFPPQEDGEAEELEA